MSDPNLVLLGDDTANPCIDVGACEYLDDPVEPVICALLTALASSDAGAGLFVPAWSGTVVTDASEGVFKMGMGEDANPVMLLLSLEVGLMDFIRGYELLWFSETSLFVCNIIDFCSF